MFAPLSGVPEDPATGSANCSLAGLLAHYNQDRNGSFSWRIAQGVEMGRPSTADRSCGKEGWCRPNDAHRRRRRPGQRRDDLPRLDSRSSRHLKNDPQLRSVFGNGFGDVKRRSFSAHVVGAHLAFLDDAAMADSSRVAISVSLASRTSASPSEASRSD